MEAPRTRRLVADHVVVSVAFLVVLVSSLTVVITLGITGDLPGFRTASSDAAAVAIPELILPTDRVAIGADREQSVPRAVDRADTIDGNRSQVQIPAETDSGSVDRTKSLSEYLQP